MSMAHVCVFEAACQCCLHSCHTWGHQGSWADALCVVCRLADGVREGEDEGTSVTCAIRDAMGEGDDEDRHMTLAWR
jgi:hypothetical protein